MNAPVTCHASVLKERLRERAAAYFPEFAGAEVQIVLETQRRRQFSQVYEFSVRSGASEQGIFVKVPIDGTWREAAEDSRERARPRLVPQLSAQEEGPLEHAALVDLQTHFSQLGDSRFQTSRVLDVLDDRAIVVESIPWPTLDQLLRRAHRLKSTVVSSKLLPLMYSAGAWLSAFHAMPVPANAVPRLTGRKSTLAVFETLLAYLRQAEVCRGYQNRLTELERRFPELASKALPTEWTTVTGHGDFGAHNVFAFPPDRVAGFDTLAHWQTSPMEDVAYFLLLLETVPPVFVSRGLFVRNKTLSDCREAFLAGYGITAQSVPSELPLFEVLVALDKWVSCVSSCLRTRGLRRAAKRCRLTLQQRLLWGRIHRLLNGSAAATLVESEISLPEPTNVH